MSVYFLLVNANFPTASDSILYPVARFANASANFLYASEHFLHASERILHASELFLHTSERFLHVSAHFLHASEHFLHASERFLHASERFLYASARLATASGNFMYDRASIPPASISVEFAPFFSRFSKEQLSVCISLVVYGGGKKV